MSLKHALEAIAGEEKNGSKQQASVGGSIEINRVDFPLVVDGLVSSNQGSSWPFVAPDAAPLASRSLFLARSRY